MCVFCSIERLVQHFHMSSSQIVLFLSKQCPLPGTAVRGDEAELRDGKKRLVFISIIPKVLCRNVMNHFRPPRGVASDGDDDNKNGP